MYLKHLLMAIVLITVVSVFAGSAASAEIISGHVENGVGVALEGVPVVITLWPTGAYPESKTVYSGADGDFASNCSEWFDNGNPCIVGVRVGTTTGSFAWYQGQDLDTGTWVYRGYKGPYTPHNPDGN